MNMTEEELNVLLNGARIEQKLKRDEVRTGRAV